MDVRTFAADTVCVVWAACKIWSVTHGADPWDAMSWGVLPTAIAAVLACFAGEAGYVGRRRRVPEKGA